MITHELKYRLGEYLIIDNPYIMQTWVSHTAIGTQISGKCSIIGNILLIGPKEHEEDGFLKLEFNEHLRKLPHWDKTVFYCFVSSIRKISTGTSILDDLSKNFIPLKKYNSTMDIFDPGVFRLRQYKITVGQNNIINWQTVGEWDKIISGKCFIESGILFIGPKERNTEHRQSRRDFFTSLKLLEKWDKTFAWGHYGSLIKCNEPEPQRLHDDVCEPGNPTAHMKKKTASCQPKKDLRDCFYDYSASGARWLRTTSHRLIEWHIWKRLRLITIDIGRFIFRFFTIIIKEYYSKLFRALKRFFK